MVGVSNDKPDHIPTISAVMTPFPWVISMEDSLATAKALMKGHAIRHLPVTTNKGRAIGVVSHRDIYVAESVCFDEAEQESLTVADAAVRNAYIVNTHERLDRVLIEMASRHIGSAIVVKDDKVAGIFTVTDACRHFGEFLRRMFPDQGDDVVA